MKQKKLYPKVAFDIFYEQFKWSIWFISILTAIHVIVLLFFADARTEIGGFFEFSRYSTAIFMLVSGIMASYVFLSAYVQQGISRKDVYRGIGIGAFGLALFLTILPLLLNGVEYLLSEYMSLPLTFSSYGSAADWFVEVLIYLLNIFTYYLVGWLISIGYYRFGWMIGFLFIALAIVALSLNGYFWGDEGISSIIPWIPNNPIENSPSISFIGSLILIAALLAAMRLLTKRVAIKM